MTWGADVSRDSGHASGSSVAVNTDTVNHASKVSDTVDVGKRSRVPQGPNYTGDPYVDHGPACQDSGPDCYLPADVRDRLIREIQSRIDGLGSLYQRACDHVRLVRMLTPQVQINPIVAMLFDALTTGFATRAVSSFAAWRGAAMASAHNMELELHQLGLQGRVAGIEPAMVAQKFGVLSAKAKAQVFGALPSDVPAQAQSFLSALQHGAAVGFQTMREALPGIATDIELVALREAFDITHHEQGTYEAAINEKVERFLASGVNRIGRHSDTEGVDHVSSKAEADPYAGTDVRVAYARFVSGFPTKLFYQHAASRMSGKESGAMTWGSGDRQPAETKPGISAKEEGGFFVPDEFRDIALQRHLAQWGGMPPVVDIDDSGWIWEPARVQAAKARKRRNAPVLDLASGAVGKPADIKADNVPTIDEIVKKGFAQ